MDVRVAIAKQWGDDLLHDGAEPAGFPRAPHCL